MSIKDNHKLLRGFYSVVMALGVMVIACSGRSCFDLDPEDPKNRMAPSFSETCQPGTINSADEMLTGDLPGIYDKPVYAYSRHNASESVSILIKNITGYMQDAWRKREANNRDTVAVQDCNLYRLWINPHVFEADFTCISANPPPHFKSNSKPHTSSL